VDLFISYASADRSKLTPLLDDLHRLHFNVWFDEELTGGQVWWDTVLERIRSCGAMLPVLSPAFRESDVCKREVEYAQAMGKPVLPVMIESVRPELIFPSLAAVQVVDYTRPGGNAAFDLMGALRALPSRVPLPDPLPDPPAVPSSYPSSLSERIRAPSPALDEQLALPGQPPAADAAPAAPAWGASADEEKPAPPPAPAWGAPAQEEKAAEPPASAWGLPAAQPPAAEAAPAAPAWGAPTEEEKAAEPAAPAWDPPAAQPPAAEPALAAPAWGAPATVPATVAGAPAPALLGVPDVERLINQAVKKLKWGQIAFNPPHRMTVHRIERIEARVQRSLDPEFLEGMQGSGSPQVESLKVGAFMTTTLSGPTFDITPLNPDRQLVQATRYTKWAWDVTARQRGRHNLALSVSVRIPIPPMEENVEAVVLEREIKVRVNASHRLGQFIREHWKWAIGTVISAIIAALLTTWLAGLIPGIPAHSP
jgi:hypothetical protein